MEQKSELRTLLDLVENEGFEITEYKVIPIPKEEQLLSISMTSDEQSKNSSVKIVSLFEENGYWVESFGYSQSEVMVSLTPKPKP